MSYQLKFAPSVAHRLREKIKREDENLLSAYLRKDKFTYSFEEDDYVFCDFSPISASLGGELKETFFSNLSSEKKNDYRDADFECAKLLYENLNLTPRQAADKDFWNYLHHHDMYQYLHSRWNEIENPSKGSQETYIFRHWLMSLSSQKHLINYPLTTLWWSIHLTIDLERQDSYELSRIYFNNNRYRTVTFGGSSYVRHKEAILGILEFYQENNIPETKELGDKISKFVNLLGGTKPLAFFNRTWYKRKLEVRFPELVKRKSKSNYGTETLIQNPVPGGGIDTTVVKPPREKIKPMEKIQSDNPISPEKTLCYLSLFREGKYFLKSYPLVNAPFCIPIPSGCKKGYLLFCYDNGRVNKVPVAQLLKKTIDQTIPYWGGLNRDANLLEVTCIPEDCLLLVTVNDPFKGKSGKIHRTRWIPEKEVLNGKGAEISIHTNNLNYSVLPENLDTKLSRLIQPGSSTLCPKNNTFYRKEWEFLKNYLKEQIDSKSRASEPEIPFPEKETPTQDRNLKYLNIYETGLFYFSESPSSERLVRSVPIPSNDINDKYLFFCYDNGQVTKLPISKLPELNLEVRVRNGKYSRAGLIYLGVGETDAHVLICRHLRNYGRCYKIHKGEWISESEKMNARGTEVVNTLTNLKYTLLPTNLDQRLNKLISRETRQRILLDHHSYQLEKAILYKLVPEFFEE